MTDTRRKNVNWRIESGSTISFDAAQLAVLMDLRDEMQAIRSLLNCYRVPRALDAMHELGVEARRRKRKARAT